MAQGPAILVAQYADLNWPLLYPGVDGIIIEQAGPLSHAIFAFRDQRIPTVIGVSNLTTWLAEGDLVDMDGASGVVRKIDDSDPIYSVRSQPRHESSSPVGQSTVNVDNAHEDDEQVSGEASTRSDDKPVAGDVLPETPDEPSAIPLVVELGKDAGSVSADESDAGDARYAEASDEPAHA
jgi:phosphohistidine swiveling domain-containing protein